MKIEVTFYPTNSHLKEIKKWLNEEDEEDKFSNEGFINHWNTIETSFKTKELIVITEDNLTIGFLTYNIYENVVNIQFVEVQASKREKGIATQLLNESFKWFIKYGGLVAQLYCKAGSPEKIWRNIGFSNFPNKIIKESNTYLYKILVKTTDLYKENRKTELIELWDFEDSEDNTESKWKWEVKRKANSNELIHPIIHPSSGEWSVGHRIGSEITEKTIMKNFNMKKHDAGHFMIVKELEK